MCRHLSGNLQILALVRKGSFGFGGSIIFFLFVLVNLSFFCRFSHRYGFDIIRIVCWCQLILLYSILTACRQTLKCLLFLDLVFIWLSNRPMWFGFVHYCATETILSGYGHVSMHMAVTVLNACVYVCACLCVCGRQAVSSGEAQCGGGRGEQG